MKNLIILILFLSIASFAVAQQINGNTTNADPIDRCDDDRARYTTWPKIVG